MLPRVQSTVLAVLALTVATLVPGHAAPATPAGVTLTLVNDLDPNPPGNEVSFLVQGAPGLPTFLLADSDPGPSMVLGVQVMVGQSSNFFFLELPATGVGTYRVDCVLNCDSALFGTTVYLQALQIGGGGVCVSNGETVLWDDLNGECGGEDLCPGMGVKPQVLTMSYTGEDCSASNNSQDPAKVSCSGDPALASPAHIIARSPSGMEIWFEGDVPVGGSFDIDATSAGATRLKGDTVVEVFDSGSGALLQTVQFHTSCSQPLIAGEQFGSLVLEGFVAEP